MSDIDQSRRTSHVPDAFRAPVDAPATGVAAEDEPVTTMVGEALRCQWCSVPLPANVTICPNCGSPGVPDPRFSDPMDSGGPTGPLAARLRAPAPDAVLDPWREDTTDGPQLDFSEPPAPQQISWEDAERRQFNTILIAGVAVISCALVGWLAAPLLAGVVENLTGTPVENTSDLRPFGALLGLLSGFAIGAIAGIVIWSNR
jgi:hypothetical protein